MTYTHWEKTKFFTFFLSLLTVIIVLFVQLRADAIPTRVNCSYFDPITIDLLAFAVSLFLVIEGIYRLHEHKQASFSRQFTRVVRVVTGAAIFSLHVFQFLHK